MNIPSEQAEDTILTTFFSKPPKPQPNPPGHEKIHHSVCTTEGQDARARKKERMGFKDVRRAPFIYEKMCHMRAQEVAS